MINLLESGFPLRRDGIISSNLMIRNDSPESMFANRRVGRIRLPRFERVARFRPVTIGRPKHLILAAIGRYHYLSAPQLTRLLYADGSLTFVRHHLMELFHARFLQRLYLRTSTPHGSPLAIYALDRRGYAYLKRA